MEAGHSIGILKKSNLKQMRKLFEVVRLMECKEEEIILLRTSTPEPKATRKAIQMMLRKIPKTLIMQIVAIVILKG